MTSQETTVCLAEMVAYMNRCIDGSEGLLARNISQSERRHFEGELRVERAILANLEAQQDDFR